MQFLLFPAIHSITKKKAIIEEMKANWAASCSTDDHCSQWEFSKYETTAMKYNQGPVFASKSTD